MTRNNLDLSGFPRLEEGNNYEQEVTDRIESVRAWEQNARRQERENFWKWVMVCAGTVVVIVLALVWTNQLP